jgi:hypothetical protein
VRRPEPYFRAGQARKTSIVGDATFLPAIERIALIMAAKGGTVRDITPGDCLELLKSCREVFTDGRRTNRHSPFFYQLLHSVGIFPDSAPPTVRMFSTRSPGSSPSSNSSTATTWPAVPSATCSWTTCANASPASTTTP